MGKCFPNTSLVSMNPSVQPPPLFVSGRRTGFYFFYEQWEWAITLLLAPTGGTCLLMTMMKERRFWGLHAVGDCALLGDEKKESVVQDLLWVKYFSWCQLLVVFPPLFLPSILEIGMYLLSFSSFPIASSFQGINS